jgi:predicted enzyme related to lactoylglutathione lyase
MTGPRRPGDFCWFNILTPDAEAARLFFAELFGWGYGEIPGLGHTVLVGAARSAGCST